MNLEAADPAGRPTVHEGGCLCGAIRYRAEGRPLRVNYCHCGQCRRHAGAPVAAFATFASEAVRFTKGTPRLFRSSSFAQRGFCPDCGTPLTWQADAEPQSIDLGIGTFDDASALLPQEHLWVESAVPWLHIDDALPRYRRSREPKES